MAVNTPDPLPVCVKTGAFEPVTLAIPAVALSTAHDPVDEVWAANFAYNEDDEASALRLDCADEALDAWEPPTQRDFIRKFLAMFYDGALPNPARLDALIRQGQRLIA